MSKERREKRKKKRQRVRNVKTIVHANDREVLHSEEGIRAYAL